MSATVVRQGGRIHLEQSDMHLAFDMAKMPRGGYLHTTTEGTEYLIKTARADVREEKTLGVEFSGHNTVQAAMERHLAMLRQNQPDSCLPCPNGTAQNPHTHWKHRGTGAPPPERLRQLTPELTPQPPGTPPVPPGVTVGTHPSGIEGMLLGYVYIHTPLPSAQVFNHDAYAKDRMRDRDFDSDLLTDERTSIG